MEYNQLILSSVLLLPLIAAIVNLFLWGNSRAQRWVGNLFVVLHLVVSALVLKQTVAHSMIVLNVGDWLHGYGIMLAVDALSAGMIAMASLLALLAWFYSYEWFTSESVKALFNVVYFFLLMGLTGAFMAADLFNLYVWFEVLLVSSFVLFTLGGKKAQLEGTLKYVAINVFSSTIFLAGIGVIYGLTGTVNMAAAGIALDSLGQSSLANVAAVFFLVSFGIKAAVFPLFFWLPATYHTAPIGISSLVVALMTKVGVYVLIRFFTIVFPISENEVFRIIFMLIAAFTMVVGVFGAAAQSDFRKILSFHIVSQIGYMIMGLAIGTPLAIAGALFFVLHNVLVKTNLFFISGLVNRVAGSYSLKQLGGVLSQFPLLALVFAISAFALTGVPPLTGFWGKFILAKAGFMAGDWEIVTVSLAVSLITLFSMTKIWNQVFWKPLPQGSSFSVSTFSQMAKSYPSMVLVVLCLTMIILGVSFFPNQFIEYAERAAQYVVNRTDYINAVLNR